MTKKIFLLGICLILVMFVVGCVSGEEVPPTNAECVEFRSDDVYSEFAFKIYDPICKDLQEAACYNLSTTLTKALCFGNMGNMYGDSEVCDEIKNVKLELKTDYEGSELLSKGAKYDDVYSFCIAMATKNNSYCLEIGDILFKEDCLEAI